MDLPEAYGGFGTNFLFSMVIAEESSRANCGAVGGPMMVHSDIVCHYVLNNGSEEQKQRYSATWYRVNVSRLLPWPSRAPVISK